MSRVHAAYRSCCLALVAGACALAAGCDAGHVVPALARVTPALVCGGTAAALTLDGSGFEARVDGVLGAATSEIPTVSVAASGGSPVLLPSRWRSTAMLDATVAPGLLAAGRYDVSVANPDGARATLLQALASDASPAVDNVMPVQLCATGGSFTVTGSGFAAGATVSVSDGTRTLPGSNVAVTSATQLTVQLGANTFANNAALDLTVTNPDGCSGTLATALHRKTGAGGCP